MKKKLKKAQKETNKFVDALWYLAVFLSLPAAAIYMISNSIENESGFQAIIYTLPGVVVMGYWLWEQVKGKLSE